MPDAMPLDSLFFDPGSPYFLPYGRCSTIVQLQGETIKGQEGKGEDSNERIAASLNLPLHPGRFFDALSGYTGANLLHGVLKQITDDALSGRMPQGSVLCLDEWTRFSRRQVRHSASLALNVINAGVGIYVKRKKRLYSSAVLDKLGPMEGLFVLFEAFMDLAAGHADSKEKGIKVRRTKEDRHETAAVGGLVISKQLPAYFEVIGDDGRPAGSFKDDRSRRVVKQPAQAAILQRIFDEALVHGAQKISDGLRADWAAGVEGCQPWGDIIGRVHRKKGHPNHGQPMKSGGWHPQVILDIIRNPAAKGHARRVTFWHDEETGMRKRKFAEETYRNAAWPQIISEEQWDAAQRMIEGRRAKSVCRTGKRVGQGGRRGDGMPNLLQGIVRCGHCHGPMAFYSQLHSAAGKSEDGKQSRRKHTYLQCRSSRIGTCQHKVRHGYDAAETFIGSVVKEFLFRPGVLDAKRSPTDAASEVDRLKSRIDLLQRRYDEWDDLEDDDRRKAGEKKAIARSKELAIRHKELEEASKRLCLEESSGGRQEHMLLVRQEWDTATGPGETVGRTAARTRVNNALRAVVDYVFCKPNGTIGLTAGGGMAGAVQSADGLATWFRIAAGGEVILEHGPDRILVSDQANELTAMVRESVQALANLGAERDARRTYQENQTAG